MYSKLLGLVNMTENSGKKQKPGALAPGFDIAYFTSSTLA